MEQLSVPVIDIAPFLRDASSPEATAVISAIRDACLTCGFFLVTGHSVPEADISRCWSSVRDFFDESVELKIETPMRVSYPYGYNGMGSEKAGNDIKSGAYDTSDLKESFAICLSSATKPAPALPTPLWPRSPPGFKDAVTTYYRDMEALSSSLLSILALTLELPRDYFASLSDQHWGALRCLNYPSQSVAPNPGQLRIAAHTDYGALTRELPSSHAHSCSYISEYCGHWALHRGFTRWFVFVTGAVLKADDAPGGLQVQRKDGSWSDVSIPSDAYCVNLGDLMSRLSNDMYKSTMHRVVRRTKKLFFDERKSYF